MANMMLGSVLAALLVGGGACGSGVVPEEHCGAVSQFGECLAGAPGGSGAPGSDSCDKGCDCIAQLSADFDLDACITDCRNDPPPADCMRCVEQNTCEVLLDPFGACASACAADDVPQ
jgi:hypothetical protein